MTFDDACFITPIINIEAVLCYKWSALAIGIITRMENENASLEVKQNILFQLIYYKACVTHQVLYKPVQDHDTYGTIYNKVMEMGIYENYFIPDFDGLHDWPRKKRLDSYESDVRLAIIALCKLLAYFGLELVIPFSIITPRVGKVNKCEPSRFIFNAKFCSKWTDWPRDKFYNEITPYLPGGNGFISTPIRGLFSKSEDEL